MPYSYNSLDPSKHEVRVLRRNENHNDRSQWILDTIDLDVPDYSPFHALSYEWHPPGCRDMPMQELLLAGGSLSVTLNLYEALNCLRQLDISGVWIDAICINQEDPKEKGHQVLQMRRVYAAATGVLIWPGLDFISHTENGGTFASELKKLETKFLAVCQGMRVQTFAKAFKYMEISSMADAVEGLGKDAQHVSLSMDRFKSDPSLRESWQIFTQLFNLSYWSRRWITQELYAAHQVCLIMKSQKVPFQIDLKTSMQALAFISGPTIDHPESWYKGMPGLNRNACRITTLVWQPLGSEADIELDLFFLLNMFSTQETNQPKDRIYSLLGIAKPYKISQPVIDYTLSTAQVYRDLAIYIITGHGTLNILTCGGKSSRDLPSWAPNWLVFAPDRNVCYQQMMEHLGNAHHGLKAINDTFGFTKRIAKKQFNGLPSFSSDLSLLHTGAWLFKTASMGDFSHIRLQGNAFHWSWYVELCNRVLWRNYSVLQYVDDPWRTKVIYLLLSYWYDTMFEDMEIVKEEKHKLMELFLAVEQPTLEGTRIWKRRLLEAHASRVTFYFYFPPTLAIEFLRSFAQGSKELSSIQREHVNNFHSLFNVARTVLENQRPNKENTRILKMLYDEPLEMLESVMTKQNTGLWLPAIFARHRRNPPDVTKGQVMACIPGCDWYLLLRPVGNIENKFEIVTSVMAHNTITKTVIPKHPLERIILA